MKKLFFWALASLFVFSSCNNEELLPSGNEGEPVQMNIVAGLSTMPKLRATAVNAGSQNSGIDNVDPDLYSLRYMLEIRDASGATVTHQDMKTVDISSAAKSASFSVTLIRGKEYKFVVWADITMKSAPTADHHYITANGLDKIEMNESKFVINDESKDAFFVSENRIISTSSNAPAINLTLTRPLGKIRFVSADYSMISAADQAAIRTTANSNYYNLSTTATLYKNFNAVTGDVDTTTPLDRSKVTANTPAAATVSADGKELTMFWDYAFVPVATQLRVGFTIRYTINNATTNNYTDSKIVLERNKLTTVRASMFTVNQLIEVNINDSFDDYLSPINARVNIDGVPYNSIADAMVAAQSGDIISLTEGIFVEDVDVKTGVTLQGMGNTTTITGYLQAQTGSTLKDFTSNYLGKTLADGSRTRTSLYVAGSDVTVDNVTFDTDKDNYNFTSSSNNRVEAIVISMGSQNFIFKNSTINAPFWKGIYLNVSQGVQITDNTFNGMNPFSVDNYDASFTVTGNTFVRNSFATVQMIHIVEPTYAGNNDPVTWSADLIASISQIKENNTWQESSVSMGGATGNYSKVVRINGYLVGKPGTDPTAWFIANA